LLLQLFVVLFMKQRNMSMTATGRQDHVELSTKRRSASVTAFTNRKQVLGADDVIAVMSHADP